MSWNKKLWGIKYKEYLFIGAFYSFFAGSYYTTLWLNRQAYLDPDDPFFDLEGISIQGLDYLLKLIYTIPIWWLIFRKLKHLPLFKRLLFHVLFLPIFPYVWQQTYYFILESMDYGHLQGSGQVWDIYIPGLFYILQFGVLHAYEYYQTTKEQLKKEAELKEATLKSELSALKAQLNPHFLYNVFNTISASVPPELEKTREMIANLSDLFRFQLRASQSEVVPLKDELEFVNQYLNLEKERFGNRLKVSINVPEDLLEVAVPPMILQPIVENAIKHGISTSMEGGEVAIGVRKMNNKLEFEVADTGVGVKDKSELLNKGVGLTNTNLRLDKMYNSTLSFTDNAPNGLIVRFTL